MLYFELVNSDELGVKKKIEYQIKALKKYYNDIEWIGSKNEKNLIYIKDKKYKLYFGKNFLDKVFRKICILKILLGMKNYNLKNKKIIYIRYFGSSYVFLNLLKYLKKNNLKIILEIPTYPYDNERKGNSLFFLSDKFFRKKLYKYVDKIVTFSNHNKIWEIPCINISNGINLEEVKMVNTKFRENDKLVFTSVSNCSFWHGIDRFLLSLEKYGELEKNKEIIFYIVGEGSESKQLKEIVKKSSYLSRIVKFEGFKSGDELDYIYDNTNIAVGSLGIHRIGLKTVQPLKNREYTAKGLPFIISFIDSDFENVKYIFRESSNEKLIDIQKIIEWYETNNFAPEDIRRDASRFTWDLQMKKIIDNI